MYLLYLSTSTNVLGPMPARYIVYIYGILLFRMHVCRVVASTMATKLNTTSATSSNIIAKPNTTSPIWTHYGLLADDNGKPKRTVDCITCRLCETTVMAKTGNTSNLFNH